MNTFTLKSGQVLEIKPIKPMLIMRWEDSYNKKHPTPQPPKKILPNGDEWYDQEDVVYAAAMEKWSIAKVLDLWTWLYDLGVNVTVPDNWAPAVDDDRPRRAQYVFELCEDEAENVALQEAIMGQTVATSKAVTEAEKN